MLLCSPLKKADRLSAVLSYTLAVTVHYSKVVCGLYIILLGGLFEELGCLFVLLRHKPPGVVLIAKVELSHSEAVIRCLSKIFRGFFAVRLHSKALRVNDAQRIQS